MPKDVIDISRWFIKNNSDVAFPSYKGNIKLQKLLYYSQAMHLAVKGEPLFVNSIEAWENGPVVRDAFREYRHNHLAEITSMGFGDVGNLDPDTSKILKVVNYIYGKQTGDQLVELTHNEEPWKELEDEVKQKLNPIITRDKMISYYSSLVEIYDAFKDLEIDTHKSHELNGNVFTLDESETTLTDDDIRSLWEIGNEIKGQKLFVYKEDDELVVY
jgi:uncharacterized phage-associated protein